MKKTIGQAAYETWVKEIRGDNLHRPWKHLHPYAKRRWETIALAAVNQHIDDGIKD